MCCCFVPGRGDVRTGFDQFFGCFRCRNVSCFEKICHTSGIPHGVGVQAVCRTGRGELHRSDQRRSVFLFLHRDLTHDGLPCKHITAAVTMSVDIPFSVDLLHASVIVCMQIGREIRKGHFSGLIVPVNSSAGIGNDISVTADLLLCNSFRHIVLNPVVAVVPDSVHQVVRPHVSDAAVVHAVHTEFVGNEQIQVASQVFAPSVQGRSFVDRVVNVLVGGHVADGFDSVPVLGIILQLIDDGQLSGAFGIVVVDGCLIDRRIHDPFFVSSAGTGYIDLSVLAVNRGIVGLLEGDRPDCLILVPGTGRIVGRAEHDA